MWEGPMGLGRPTKGREGLYVGQETSRKVLEKGENTCELVVVKSLEKGLSKVQESPGLGTDSLSLITDTLR